MFFTVFFSPQKNVFFPPKKKNTKHQNPGNSTTIKTMGVNITTIVYLRVLIIEIGSTIVLMVVEAHQQDHSFGGFRAMVASQVGHPNQSIRREQ